MESLRSDKLIHFINICCFSQTIRNNKKTFTLVEKSLHLLTTMIYQYCYFSMLMMKWNFEKSFACDDYSHNVVEIEVFDNWPKSAFLHICQTAQMRPKSQRCLLQKRKNHKWNANDEKIEMIEHWINKQQNSLHSLFTSANKQTKTQKLKNLRSWEQLNEVCLDILWCAIFLFWHSIACLAIGACSYKEMNNTNAITAIVAEYFWQYFVYGTKLSPIHHCTCLLNHT